MNGAPLRAPREEDAEHVARLMSEGSPEPIARESVLRDWTFPGVQVEMDVRLGPGFDESVGMRVSAQFAIHEKSVP